MKPRAVQQRGRAIIDARKLSSAMSAAKAIADHLRTWLVTGTAAGETVSMGVVSTRNPYGVPDDLVFSFPVRCGGDGTREIVAGRAISDGLRTRLNAPAQELQEEWRGAKEAQDVDGQRRRRTAATTSAALRASAWS